MNRDEDHLFWEYDWHSVVESQKQQLRKKIDNLSAEDLSKGTLDEFAESLAGQFEIEPPTIFPNKLEVSQREVEIDFSGDPDRYFSRSGPHNVKGTAIDVRLPFEGDKEMFRVKPTTYNFSPPRGRISQGYIEFTVEGVNLTKEQVQTEIDGRVNSISEFLEFQTNSIGNLPTELRQIAYQSLEQRQHKLQADSDLISDLGYQIRDK